MASVWGGIALILATNLFCTFTRKTVTVTVVVVVVVVVVVTVACKVFSIKVASDFS